jgi:hypothetical protein
MPRAKFPPGVPADRPDDLQGFAAVAEDDQVPAFDVVVEAGKEIVAGRLDVGRLKKRGYVVGRSRSVSKSDVSWVLIGTP